MASLLPKLFQSHIVSVTIASVPLDGPRLMALCMPTPELAKDDERDERDERDELGSRWDFLAAGSEG